MTNSAAQEYSRTLSLFSTTFHIHVGRFDAGVWASREVGRPTAGIEANVIGPHTLRHTFAVRALQARAHGRGDDSAWLQMDG